MKKKSKKTTLRISGMHCASCAINIEKKLKSVKGVLSAQVNYASEQAIVEHENTIDDKLLAETVKQVGYKAIAEIKGDSQDTVEKEKAAELRTLKTKLLWSAFFTAFLLVGTLIPFAPKVIKNHLVMWALATPVQFWVGAQYYKSAWSALKNRLANMDTLIALGTSVAYFYSVFVVIFTPHLTKLNIPLHVYFETSATIITLILLGKYLETKAKGQTSEATKKLLQLGAKTARAVRGGKEVEIPIEQISKGEIIIVKPGEKIPVDGIIIQGDSSIDESMITGESMAIHKKINDKVIGATISKNGSFTMKATGVGQETMLAQIIEMVKHAQASKAPIQKLADSISSYFVPTVIILSMATFLIWF